jgi:hypothetical protein
VLLNYLRWGVLRLVTPLGPRYIRPRFLERVYLIWVFRNFRVLPQQVLSRTARSLIEELCTRQNARPNGFIYSIIDQPVVGTVERNPQPDSEYAPARSRRITGASAVAFSRRPQ